MFYLTTHSTHFIYGYMASDIWLRTILIVRKETRCRHIGYSYRLTARVLLCAPSHRQDNTYHGLCYTSRVIIMMMITISDQPATYSCQRHTRRSKKRNNRTVLCSIHLQITEIMTKPFRLKYIMKSKMNE